MKYDYTVEHPHGLTGSQLRKAIKYRMSRKKKMGYKIDEPVYDSDLGIGSDTEVKYDTDAMNKYLKDNDVIQR